MARLIPFQHAQSQKQAVGSVLLNRRAGSTVYIFQRIEQFRLREVRHQLVALHQACHLRVVLLSLLGRVVHAVLAWFYLRVGTRRYAVVLALLQMVFQMFDDKRHERHHPLAQSGVQKIVAQREVEQLTFPYLLFGQLRVWQSQKSHGVIGFGHIK